MAWTDLSGAFGYGTKLTSAQQGQLRNNAILLYAFLASCNLTDHGILLGSGTGAITPTAAMTNGQMLVGQSGADPLPKTMSGNGTLSAAGALAVTGTAANAITQTSMADSAIGQAELKTSMSAVSVVGAVAHTTLPGGEYGFYPQVKSSEATASREVLAYISAPAGTVCSTTYVTNITLGNEDGEQTGYAQQRYVTASGEIFWVFLLRDKITKKIVRTYHAPDHPCFGNGGKPLIVQHPFGYYDKEKYELIVINPTTEEVEEIQLNCEIDDETLPDKDFLDVLLEDYEIDEISTPVWPTEAVTVGLPKKIEVEVDGKMVMIPVDWRSMPTGTKVTPIKKVIPKPDKIIHRSLKKKK